MYLPSPKLNKGKTDVIFFPFKIKYTLFPPVNCWQHNAKQSYGTFRKHTI